MKFDTFTFQSSELECISVEISQNLTEGTSYGSYTWKSSILLSDAIVARKIPMNEKNVLELGAGTGLSGIVSLLCGSNYVTFTDMSMSDGERIQRNAYHNGVKSFNFLPYNWEDMPNGLLDSKFDVILAADCLFDKTVLKPFSEALSLLLHKNRDAIAYVAYEHRGTHTDLDCLFSRVGLEIAILPSAFFDLETFYLFKIVVAPSTVGHSTE